MHNSQMSCSSYPYMGNVNSHCQKSLSTWSIMNLSEQNLNKAPDSIRSILQSYQQYDWIRPVKKGFFGVAYMSKYDAVLSNSLTDPLGEIEKFTKKLISLDKFPGLWVWGFGCGY